MTWPKQNRHC